MLKITIVEGHNLPQQRTTKNGIRHFQMAYAHLGGAYPTAIEIPLRGPAYAYSIGEYQIDSASFRVGKFRNLELNPFELKLIPMAAKPALAKTA